MVPMPGPGRLVFAETVAIDATLAGLAADDT
jgi:hypothetical protein